MAEFAGLAYFTETPAVVVDVQRMGPSTGLPTRTSQGDVLALALLSHGDTRHPLLFPAAPKEYFAMAVAALDLAQRLQTVVFVAADLDLGMNRWIDDPFAYPERPLDHGKVLSARDLEAIDSLGRYRDVDGDGIPYRTCPATRAPRRGFSPGDRAATRTPGTRSPRRSTSALSSGCGARSTATSTCSPAL